ncbi:MAG: apolipoprotein N-acyltransferase [Flavobacteriales bacterium]|nr:apolipoprotein N-acyltransferase [Flavobacteriales bacterium]
MTRQTFTYSILSGILLGLANNEVFGLPMALLAWVALVPVLLALRQAQGFVGYFFTGYVFSLVYLFIAMFSFLTAYFVGGAVLIAVGALQFSLPFVVSYFLQNRVGWKRSLFILPLLWPVVEWFVLESALSMPLFAMYISQAPMLWLVQHIDIFGYSAISFWLVLLNVLIAIVIADTSTNATGKVRLKKLFTIAFAMFMPPLAYAFFIHSSLEDNLDEKVTVSLIQSGNAPHLLVTDSAMTMNVMKYAELTTSAVEQSSSDLVIWPEGAMPVPIIERKVAREQLMINVLKWNTPLLTGCLDRKLYESVEETPALQQYLDRDYEVYNSAAMLTPQLAWRHLKNGLDISSLKLYHKQQLMPFTEYVPYSDKWPCLSKLTIDLGDGANFSAGEGPTSLLFATRDERVVKVSPIICWDIFYPLPSIKAAREGKNFIAALTNESRLDDLPTIAYEVECFTRLRSIETRRSIAKCGTTGRTFFTDPFGRVYGKVPTQQAVSSTEEVQLSKTRTVYSRWPQWFPIFCAIGSVSMFIISFKTENKFLG